MSSAVTMLEEEDLAQFKWRLSVTHKRNGWVCKCLDTKFKQRAQKQLHVKIPLEDKEYTGLCEILRKEGTISLAVLHIYIRDQATPASASAYTTERPVQDPEAAG